jgi:hypothetical protein
MSDTGLSWQIEGWAANLKCGPLEGCAGCAPDGLDFIPEKWNGCPVEGISVLMSAGPRGESELLEISERYVRGSDFVGKYSYAGAQRIAPEVYWRAHDEPSLSAVALELVLSVHTELLDSTPASSISSYVHNCKLFHSCDLTEPHFDEVTQGVSSFNRARATDHLFVFRSEAHGLSYAQMVHPSDFVSANISFDGPQPLFLDTTLFPERLEKGVIRRGRGWFMPAENDLQTAVALARQFVDEPLPLTA